MSHRVARRKLSSALTKLNRHRSGDPEFELDEEKIFLLREEIELAQEHLQEDDDAYCPSEYFTKPSDKEQR